MLNPDTILQNRYRIVRPLGKGGMGTVYAAKDQRFNSTIALKEANFEQARLRKAFEREARLLNLLRHPALPVVMDYFVENNRQFLVMQFIPGKDLGQILQERTQRNLGPFALDETLAWTDQLLDALEYLHGRKPPVIHRDIKPQNLKLTQRGEIVLLDFGLAKGAVNGLAQSNSLRGYTLHYSPLEQMQGTGTDPRSDLYALSATLHHLLTGEAPPSALTRATAALNGQPDPLQRIDELNPQVPAEIASLFYHALAQQPEQRPATAAELRRALGEARKASYSFNSAPTLIDEPEPTVEISFPLSSLPALTDPVAAGAAAASQFATELVAPSALIGSPAVQPSVATEVVARPGRRRMWLAGLAVSFIMFVLAWPAYRYWSTRRVQPVATSAIRVEVMEYDLNLQTAKGVNAVAGTETFRAGQRFNFRFKARQSGYLYIIAPNESNVLETLLTAQPNPAWRMTEVQLNYLTAGADYSFPPPRNGWIEITGGVGSDVHTVIFAPTPLPQPNFLAQPAGYRLNTAEQNELARLRARFGQAVQTEVRGNQSVVTLPETARGAPFLFEITLKRQ